MEEYTRQYILVFITKYFPFFQNITDTYTLGCLEFKDLILILNKKKLITLLRHIQDIYKNYGRYSGQTINSFPDLKRIHCSPYLPTGKLFLIMRWLPLVYSMSTVSGAEYVMSLRRHYNENAATLVL